MATFSDIAEGFAARKRGVRFTSLTGKECVCDLRVVTGIDDDAILERAAKRASALGQATQRGNPTYDFACACELVALAAIDPDSAEDAPRPFFDKGVAQVRERLDRDRINFLAEQQAQFQATVCPLKRELTEGEYWRAVSELASLKDGDADPFVQWAPSLRLSFTRTMAAQLTASLLFKSSDTSKSSATVSSGTPPSAGSSSESDRPTTTSLQ